MTIIGTGKVIFTKDGNVHMRTDPAPTGLPQGELLEGQTFNVSIQQAQADNPKNIWLQIADGPQAGQWTAQIYNGTIFCSFTPAVDPYAPVKVIVTTADYSIYWSTEFTKLS